MQLSDKQIQKYKEIAEKKAGKEWYHSEPWYRFVDPGQALKGYKIMNYLRFVKSPDNK